MKRFVFVTVALLFLTVWVTSCGGRGGATYQAPHSFGSAAVVNPSQTDQPSAPADTGGTQGSPPAAPETPLAPQFGNPGVAQLQGAAGGGIAQPTFQTPMPPGGFHLVSPVNPQSGTYRMWNIQDGAKYFAPPLPPSQQGDYPGVHKFTDPRTGYTYDVVAGQVIVLFNSTVGSPEDINTDPGYLNDSRVQAFIQETRITVGGSLPGIRCILALLPPDTSIEFAVSEWPTMYADIIEDVSPNDLGRPD